MKSKGRIIFSVAGGLVGLIALGAGLKSCTIIPAGQVGVYDLFGKVKDEEIQSGLHFINPFATAHLMDIRTQEIKESM